MDNTVQLITSSHFYPKCTDLPNSEIGHSTFKTISIKDTAILLQIHIMYAGEKPPIAPIVVEAGALASLFQ